MTAEELDEPLAGTAARAQSWLCVEQPGPWGRDALSASHLDNGVGRELGRLAAGTGVRIVLIRRPGAHPDRREPTRRRVYLAHTAPGRTWLEQTTVEDPKELLDLDFAAAGTGTPGVLGSVTTQPMLLVCTNGRRDVCCAVRGRPVATALAATHGEAVWECTHLGGHRFAPTAIVLPTGYAYGRLDVPTGTRLLTDPTVVVSACRGRSTWPPAGQVAELAVRAHTGIDTPDAFHVGPTDTDTDTVDGWRVPVRHVDGRAWTVTVTEQQIAPARPASCGADDTRATALVAVGLTRRD